MPADPTPAPDWAVKMAASYGESWDHTTEERNDLALLLASVRDAALREAAGEVDRWAGWCANSNVEALAATCIANKVSALVGTAPKGAT